MSFIGQVSWWLEKSYKKEHQKIVSEHFPLNQSVLHSLGDFLVLFIYHRWTQKKEMFWDHYNYDSRQFSTYSVANKTILLVIEHDFSRCHLEKNLASYYQY
jgi:tetraacyldisaccharide-1-P 4'-kinase